MFINISAILIRIISSSFLNMFQKLLTKNNLSSSCVNFNSYFGLCLLTFPIFCLSFDKINYTNVLVYNVLLMGVFGALGNYFIIKALSLGQLSIVAPINAYKPIVALIVGFLYLHEVPSFFSLFGIFIIIISTFLLFKTTKTSFFRQDVFIAFWH